jgi:uncharacterized protein (TIGR02284 family)
MVSQNQNEQTMKNNGNSHASEVLNDLLKINNDRVEGYKKAADETKDEDLKNLFGDMEDESEKLASTLSQEINKLGADAKTDSTTQSGKIYRAWMDVKATFNGKDRKGVLSACEFGEDAAQKAYRTALDEELPENLKSLIRGQQVELKRAHDEIKSLRDSA